jgi:hypothetical protein
VYSDGEQDDKRGQGLVWVARANETASSVVCCCAGNARVGARRECLLIAKKGETGVLVAAALGDKQTYVHAVSLLAT